MKQEFIDLGLPSGKKWANQNEDGFYTFGEARKKFRKNLPSKKDFEELLELCKQAWDAKRKGRVFTGPNGNSIFLPADRCRNSIFLPADRCRSGCNYGVYWSSTAKFCGLVCSCFVNEHHAGIDPDDVRCSEYSVRLVQNL